VPPAWLPPVLVLPPLPPPVPVALWPPVPPPLVTLPQARKATEQPRGTK